MPDEGFRPTLLAILTCDAAIQDSATKKFTLFGLFNRLSANEFPCTHPSLHVFVSLTNGHGKAPAALRLVRRETNQVIFEAKGEIHFPSPLAVAEMHFALKNLRFPAAGPYSFDFYCNDHLIGSRPFILAEARKPES